MYKIDEALGGFLTYICAVGAVLGLIVQGIGLGLQKDDVYYFSAYSLENLEAEQYLRLCLVASNVIGVATVATTGLLIMFLFKKSKSGVWSSLVAVFLSFFATLALGAYILIFLKQTDEQVQNSAILDDGTDDGSLSSKLFEYSLALYTSCCEDKGFLRGEDDLVAEECVPGETFLDREDGASCYSNEDLYTQYMKLGSRDVCGILQDAEVNLKGLLVPKTKILITSYTEGVDVVPLVDRTSDPVYGCGSGFPLAFQYAMYRWVYQSLRPLGVASAAIGAFELVVLCGGVAYLFPGDDEDEEMYSSKVLDTAAVAEKKKKKREEIEKRAAHYLAEEVPEENPKPVGGFKTRAPPKVPTAKAAHRSTNTAIKSLRRKLEEQAAQEHDQSLKGSSTEKTMKEVGTDSKTEDLVSKNKTSNAFKDILDVSTVVKAETYEESDIDARL